MNYIVAINTLGVEHPPFQYQDLQAALVAVEDALKESLYKSGTKEGKVAIQLGTGTIIKLMSEKAIQELNSERRAARMSPLIIPGKDRASPWKMVVQLGRLQLPPLDYDTEEQADEAVEVAVRSGVFKNVIEAEHDYLWVQVGPGTIYMTLPKEQFEMQRRNALETRIREANAKPTGPQGGVIVQPGRRS